MIKLDSAVKKFDTIFAVALLALFAITASLLILISTKQYNLTTQQSNNNYSSRTVSSYVREKIRQSDPGDSILVSDSCIRLQQELETGSYSTYIYLYNGYLYEAFVKDDVEFNPATGQKLLPLASFNPYMDTLHNLHVKYVTGEGDEREVIVAIKAGKGDPLYGQSKTNP